MLYVDLPDSVFVAVVWLTAQGKTHQSNDEVLPVAKKAKRSTSKSLAHPLNSGLDMSLAAKKNSDDSDQMDTAPVVDDDLEYDDVEDDIPQVPLQAPSRNKAQKPPSDESDTLGDTDDKSS